MTNLPDRIALLELLEQRFPNGIGVEVGSASGCFTKQILATWKSCSKLHCIDIWMHQESGYDDSCNLSNEVQQERYEQFVKDFSEDKRVSIIRDFSSLRALLFEKESVDFVYLDANHSKNGCLGDLNAWFPKVRSGGILAGHDYCAGNGAGYAVKDAVDEFVAKNKLTLAVTENEYCGSNGVYGATWEGHSFVIEKPATCTTDDSHQTAVSAGS